MMMMMMMMVTVSALFHDNNEACSQYCVIDCKREEGTANAIEFCVGENVGVQRFSTWPFYLLLSECACCQHTGDALLRAESEEGETILQR
jgi:hypothetical protein